MLLAVTMLLSACSSKPSVDEEAEALARAELIKTYNQHKAKIERVALMEQDLTQLLALLSEPSDIKPLNEKLAQPEKTVTVHRAEPSAVSNSYAAASQSAFVVQFGRHLLGTRAQAQQQRINASMSLIQSYYPDMFSTVSIYSQSPAQSRTQFYLTQASGFVSEQESVLFCRLIKASGQPCKLVN
ncbi:hypothetical protein L1285_02700 [Pseudoalteromonas sp. DL2-H2.2]|uniref:hypothetical protein n=1 Tax=Pseudoalteromonas sp. DL2-H2.2 TaxID=2908889 RepID=UPI001F1B11A4|nr:hypothetical protein [Pseudoalteromonas sp. DL2-H2.2]MCF2907254.1 hypothetical protein [Pseudoalteromonas sp. DL2-H2.2]